MRPRFCALLLALLSLVVLTGCWEEPAAPTDMEEFLPTKEEAEPAEAPRATLPASFALPYTARQTLDPITCPDGMQQVVGSLLYEGLFRLDEALEPQKALCGEYICDAEGLTYTFTLRSGVVFSDGSPLTGEDVAATLRRAMASDRYRTRLYQVSSVAASGSTVTVTLSVPNTALPALLDIPIVKAGTETDLVPLGTGPYCFTSDESSATLTATGNISFQDADTTVMQYIGFNFSRAPFDQPALRQALGLGIDRDSAVSAFLSGHGTAAQLPVSPVSPLYPAALETAYSHDAFASAMAQAGYASGTPRTVTLLVNEESSFKVSVASYLASSLSAFDLQIEVRVLPWEEYMAALSTGDFDLYYAEVKLTADWNLIRLLGTSGSLNYGGWSDVQTDRLLAQYASAGDRAAAMEALCAYLQKQAPILPVCFKSTSVLYQTGVVENLTPTMQEPFYSLSSCVIRLQAS